MGKLSYVDFAWPPSSLSCLKSVAQILLQSADWSRLSSNYIKWKWLPYHWTQLITRHLLMANGIWAFQVALVVNTYLAMQVRCEFEPWVRKIPWRREWQPTPVFLPRESHGQRCLAGFSPQGHTESDTMRQLGTHWCVIMMLCIKTNSICSPWRLCAFLIQEVALDSDKIRSCSWGNDFRAENCIGYV